MQEELRDKVQELRITETPRELAMLEDVHGTEPKEARFKILGLVGALSMPKEPEEEVRGRANGCPG